MNIVCDLLNGALPVYDSTGRSLTWNGSYWYDASLGDKHKRGFKLISSGIAQNSIHIAQSFIKLNQKIGLMIIAIDQNNLSLIWSEETDISRFSDFVPVDKEILRALLNDDINYMTTYIAMNL